ncbi:tyrosine-protein phosphatase [Kitasatospora sp. CB01950]|uniref:tyrosine-protein phosphatase n=1 Tax=Kitasatospora sp. CB01950 TaxID=1703930 RepID=UPI000938BB21|nr:tyrosine-protein phosphatase [Kitasatospora sp. CB01950]OKJ13968.1 tyrosine protein phosphatase [Kitasatospora sp. CB01950]
MIADESTAADVAGLTVPGVRNFRDAGGLGALPHGVLYRSGALDGLTPDGAQKLWDLGVRTVIDVRSAPETAARPDALGDSGIRHLHVPVFPEQRWPEEQAELYPLMAEHAGRPAVAAVRALLTAERRAVLVHCASGKDRTGLVVALVQSLLGAAEPEILADFLHSNTALGLTTPGPDAPGHATRPVTAVLLRRALISVRSHHGTLDDHLRAHGARTSELASLRAEFHSPERR